MKTKRLMGRGRLAQQSQQPAAEMERRVAVSEPEEEAQTTQIEEKQQELLDTSLPASAPLRHSRVFRVRYSRTGSRRQQTGKAGYLLHHQAGHHHTLTLYSAPSLLPFQTSLLPSHHAAPAASACLSVDGFELEVEGEMNVSDWMDLQKQAEEDRKRKKEERTASKRGAVESSDGDAGFTVVSSAVQLPK